MYDQVMDQAIKLSFENISNMRGGPFGALIVKDNAIIATGINEVIATNDPTAHATIIAIRNACKALGSFQLIGCTLYASSEPCPMCLGALFWARPMMVYYGASSADAAAIDFDDLFMYEQIALPIQERALPMKQIMREEALEAFRAWQNHESKVSY